MAKLTAKARKEIAPKNFALPGRRYPIEDKGHAKAALGRVSEFGSSSEKATVRAKVHAKYPGMGKQKTSEGRELERRLSKRDKW
jgi:hypothetical protein